MIGLMDTPEAIRVAVMDLLYSQGSDDEIIARFSNLVKQMTTEMKVEPISKNETNLFQKKEQIALDER